MNERPRLVPSMLRNRCIVRDWHCFTIWAHNNLRVRERELQADGEHPKGLEFVTEQRSGGKKRSGRTRRPYRGILDYHYL